MSGMTSVDSFHGSGLLSLHQDLFDSIGSWLEDQDICSMELANNTLIRLCQGPGVPVLGLARGSWTWEIDDLGIGHPVQRPPGLPD